ncbi:MAG: phage tail tube protein [Syntrophobacteraceae bacterium]
MLTRRTVVLAKIESSYGIDPLPMPSADAILVQDLEIKPGGDAVERNYLKACLSPLQFRRGAKSVEVSFKTEMKGTGARGTIPAWGWEGALFRACGMSETVSPGVSIVYAPASILFESCTLYVYRDRIFHRVTGCRGTLSILVEAGKPAMVEWKFRGLYLSPADGVPASQTFSGMFPPIAVHTSFTIGEYSPVAQKLELNLNDTVAERRSLTAENGIAGFEITGRTPRGSFDPEAVSEAAHPFWNNWENAASMALSLTVGTVPGNRFLIEAPALQYREMGYTDKGGRAVYQVPFSLAMSAGDDELTVTFE